MAKSQFKNPMSSIAIIITVLILQVKLPGAFSLESKTKFCSGFESSDTTKKGPQFNFSTRKSFEGLVKTTAQGRMDEELVINRTSIFEIHLNCFAPYPIDFTFSGHLSNQHAQVKTFVSSFIKSGERGALLKAHCYHVNVTLETYEEITGNYSCFSVDQPDELRSSKYIYVFPPEGILLRRGQNVSIIAEPGQLTVVLPCATSKPNLTDEVQLVKLDGEDSGSWLLPSKALNYSSRVGFEMTIFEGYRKEDTMNKVLGQGQNGQMMGYQCKVAKDFINIRVTQQDWKTEPNMNILKYKIGDKINLKCMSMEEIYISVKNIIPGGNFPEKINGSLTELHYFGKNKSSNFKYEVHYLSHELNQTESLTAECKRVRDNGTLFAWRITVLNELRRNGLLDPSQITALCEKSKLIVHYSCHNWVECRMNKCLRNDRTCERAHNNCHNDMSCIPDGIVQCVNDDGELSQIYFSGLNRSNHYTDWKAAPEEDVFRIRLVHINDTKKKALDSRKSLHQLVCEGSNFVFSAGFQWSLNLKNGSTVDLMEKDLYGFRPQRTISWGSRRAILSSSLILPENVLDNKTSDMVQALSCLAPIWNTTKWMNETLDLKQIKSMLGDLEHTMVDSTWGKDISAVVANSANRELPPKIIFFLLHAVAFMRYIVGR